MKTSSPIFVKESILVNALLFARYEVPVKPPVRVGPGNIHILLDDHFRPIGLIDQDGVEHLVGAGGE